MPTNSQPWQQVWGAPQPSNNLEARQQVVINQCVTAINALDQEIGMAIAIIGNLVHGLETNLLLNQEIEQQDKLISTLLPFVQVAQIWAQDALMHEQALENVCQLLTSPGFLAYWAFKAWDSVALTDFDLDTISEQFLRLLASKGKGIPPQNRFPQPPVPFPPIPGSSAQNNTGVYAIIEALKNPQGSDTAKSLVRARNAGLI